LWGKDETPSPSESPRGGGTIVEVAIRLFAFSLALGHRLSVFVQLSLLVASELLAPNAPPLHAIKRKLEHIQLVISVSRDGRSH